MMKPTDKPTCLSSEDTPQPTQATAKGALTKQLTETQLSYKLFISITDSTVAIDTLFNKIQQQLHSLSSSYIWNNEQFRLNEPNQCETDVNKPFSIYSSEGSIDFGDNLEDEWFIVYLLNKLTESYPGILTAQVNDSDGEFLLIHAANVLPQWASSAADECTRNRVFLHRGVVHLIPPATTPALVTFTPAAGPIHSPLAAVECIQRFSSLTLAPIEIQDSISKRLSLFNSNTTLFHRYTCTIPAKLAWLFSNEPSLISIPVNRFCDKDPEDLKLCRSFTYFKPDDLVNYRVLFTKHLYGKLKYSEYKPQRGHEWPTIDQLKDQASKANMLNEIPIGAEATQRDINEIATPIVMDRSSMGFKLTCAFEIMSKHIVENKSSMKSFQIYKKRLENFGYFKGYLEHSKKYTELLETAKKSFADDISADEESTEPKSNYANLFESLYLDTIKNSDYVTKLQAKISTAKQTGQDKDDSDEWLCVEAPALDDYLEMYSRGEVSSTYDFRLISNAFKRFLKIPQSDAPGENLLDGVDFQNIDAQDPDEKLIDFDVDSIESNIAELLRLNQKAPEAVEDDDDLSEISDEDGSFYEVGDDLLEETNEEDANLADYMKEMDDELKCLKDLSRLKSSEDPEEITNLKNGGDDEELSLDLNLVTNALESYKAQLGMTGPTSNILKSIGL